MSVVTSRGSAANTPGKEDGRLLRSQRARAAVADALLELIEEGDLRPTAPRIAERAGVSLRLVFHHFTDLEALFAAAAERQMQKVLPTVHPVEAEGPLAARLEAFVGERCRLLERVAPVRRAAQLQEPFSQVISERIRAGRAWRRADIERVFAPELSACDPATRKELLAALVAVGSFSVWDQLRSHQGLPVAAAQKVMARLLAALFGVTAGRSRGKSKP